jgi:hypothetical protein
MSNKKITKSSAQIKAERKEKETVCPECKHDTGVLNDTVIESNTVTKKFKCRFPGCGCEYQIEEEHNGTVFVEAGTEDKWKSGGIQRV